MFTVRSVNTSARIQFSDLTSDYFQVELQSPEYRAVQRVSVYEDASEVATLLRDAAQCWSGWSGAKSWTSLEHELELSLTHDALGHVTLAVALRHDNGIVDPWRIRASLSLEAGQLESIALEAERFFRPS